MRPPVAALCADTESRPVSLIINMLTYPSVVLQDF
jgi:hypothetical protein